MEAPLAFKPRETRSSASRSTRMASAPHKPAVLSELPAAQAARRPNSVSGEGLDFILGDLSFASAGFKGAAFAAGASESTSSTSTRRCSRKRSSELPDDEALDHAAIASFLNVGAWNLIEPPTAAQLEKSAGILGVNFFPSAKTSSSPKATNFSGNTKITWELVAGIHEEASRSHKRARIAAALAVSSSSSSSASSPVASSATKPRSPAAELVDAVLPWPTPAATTTMGMKKVQVQQQQKPFVGCSTTFSMQHLPTQKSSRSDADKVKDFLSVGAWNDLAPSASHAELERAGQVLGLQTAAAKTVKVEWRDVSAMLTEPMRHAHTKASAKVAHSSAEATLKTKAAIATIQFPASEGPTLYESNEFGNDSSDCITGLKSTPLVKA